VGAKRKVRGSERIRKSEKIKIDRDGTLKEETRERQE